MATKRSFSKRVVRRIKRMLSPKDAEEIIRQEFEDSRGNKSRVIYDVRPHSPNKPTIEMQNTSTYTPKGDN